MTEETQAKPEAEAMTEANTPEANGLRKDQGPEQAIAEAEEGTVEAEATADIDEEPVDELALLTAELEETRAQAAEYLDGWQRARAEFANFRRRQEQRRKQIDIDAKSKVLSDLLPVVDDLERAFEAVPDDIKDHTWVNGLSLVLHKLVKALEKDGLTVLEVEAGEAFDPNYHQALTHEPSADVEGGCIIQVVQRGYKLDGSVLRPALVRVSSGELETEQTEQE
jgi:molecular chaperone GrpE